MQIPRDIIDEVRNRTSLAEVIGKYVTLTRAGTSMKGLCPFHGEKSPSFNVQEAKGVWHCFGCGEGGDVFKFLMKQENRSFVEIVEDLAERVGVAIPKAPLSPLEQQARSEADEMFIANEHARSFFINNLASPAGKGAREYLKKRGIGEELVVEYALGFCGPGWDSLARHWQQQRLAPPSGIKSGVFSQRREGKVGFYDRFHERLTFTITNSRGRVIGFGGRKMEDGGTHGEQSPKYLNSSESPVYKKSEALYGLDAARAAIGKNDRVIVVEGYFDVLGMAQAGIREVVATCGTALTPQHLTVLRRYTKNAVLLYDGDDAGRKAAQRSLPLFFEAGMAARYCALPQGEDPDTHAAKQGREKFLEQIRTSPPLAEFFIDQLYNAAKGKSAAERSSLLKRVSPVFGKVTDPLELGDYAHRLSDALDLKEDAILREIAGKGAASDEDDPSGNPEQNSGLEPGRRPDFKRAGGPSGKPAFKSKFGPPEPFGGKMATADVPMFAKRAMAAGGDRNSEEMLLRLVLGSKKVADRVRADQIHRLFKDEDLRSLGERLAEAVVRVRAKTNGDNDDQPDVAAVLDSIEGLSEAEYRVITALCASDSIPRDSTTAWTEFQAIVLRLEQRRLSERIKELRLEISAAARAKDVERERVLTSELSEAVRQVKR